MNWDTKTAHKYTPVFRALENWICKVQNPSLPMLLDRMRHSTDLPIWVGRELRAQPSPTSILNEECRAKSAFWSTVLTGGVKLIAKKWGCKMKQDGDIPIMFFSFPPLTRAHARWDDYGLQKRLISWYSSQHFGRTGRYVPGSALKPQPGLVDTTVLRCRHWGRIAYCARWVGDHCGAQKRRWI